jgi:hypothetical protein
MGLTVSRRLRCSGIVRGHQDRFAFEYMRGKLQAAHAALEKLDRVSNVHFNNPEVLAGLRLEIDRDDASTVFEGRAGGSET